MSSTNVGWRDAGIRGFLGAALLIVSAAMELPLVALAVGFVGVMLVGTALFRTCPLYTLLRIDTRGRAVSPP